MTVVLEGVYAKNNKNLIGLKSEPTSQLVVSFNSFKDLDYDKTVAENVKLTKGRTPIKVKDSSSKLKPEIINEYNFYPHSTFDYKPENAKSELYTLEVVPKKKTDLGAKSNRLTLYVYDLGKSVTKSKGKGKNKGNVASAASDRRSNVKRAFPRFKSDAVSQLFNTCGSSLFKNSCLVCSILKSLVQFYMKADKAVVDKFMTMFETISPKDIEAKSSKKFEDKIESGVYNSAIRIVIDAYASQNPEVSIKMSDDETVKKIKPKTLKHQIAFINEATNETLLSIKTVDYKGKITIDGSLVRGETKKIQVLQPLYRTAVDPKTKKSVQEFRGCITRDIDVSTRVVSNDDFVKFWKRQKEPVNTLKNFERITDTCTDGELEAMIFK